VFQQLPCEHLSADFVDRLMPEIKHAAAVKRKKKVIIEFLQIVFSVAGLLLLPMLAIRLCRYLIPNFSFSFSFTSIELDINSNVVVIGFAVLMLLIIDSLWKIKIEKLKDKR
jgi:hypothetical protein